MSLATDKPIDQRRVFNVPNQLTALRLLLSLVLFVLIGMEYYLAGAVVFAVAAGTDWVDGYWARKYGQVTQVGRILDPFADKIIICGAFIFLVAVPASGIKAWMAVVVVGRELLVTALRSFVEGEGGDFSAVMAGKLKMVLQCLAVLVSLFALWQDSRGVVRGELLEWTLLASIYAALALTIYSGATYVWRAIALLRR